MIAALAYDSKSAAQAQKLLDRIHELSPSLKLLICREMSAPDLGTDYATQTTYVDRVAHHPESKNLAFQAVAVYIAQMIKESFLYLEPDCVPRGADWFTRIADEYAGCGKPYMGPIIPESRPHNSPRHMAAIAVYPWNLIGLGGGEAMIANEEPFPAAMARGMLKFVHPTTLIQHDWEGSYVSATCALYHPDRDGSILERESGKPSPSLTSAPVCAVSGETPEAGSNPASPTSEPESAASQVDKPGTNFVPWENKLDSQEAIKRLCGDLASYCTTPRYTAFVREELASAKVIKAAGKRRRRR